jgi:hypothetical protein
MYQGIYPEGAQILVQGPIIINSTTQTGAVTDDEFMGGKTATRISAGSVTIIARHCNLLGMYYDLSPVGLGTATVEVVRPAGIETSSFTCMDFEDSAS